MKHRAPFPALPPTIEKEVVYAVRSAFEDAKRVHAGEEIICDVNAQTLHAAGWAPGSVQVQLVTDKSGGTLSLLFHEREAAPMGASGAKPSTAHPSTGVQQHAAGKRLLHKIGILAQLDIDPEGGKRAYVPGTFVINEHDAHADGSQTHAIHMNFCGRTEPFIMALGECMADAEKKIAEHSRLRHNLRDNPPRMPKEWFPPEFAPPRR